MRLTKKMLKMKNQTRRSVKFFEALGVVMRLTKKMLKMKNQNRRLVLLKH